MNSFNFTARLHVENVVDFTSSTQFPLYNYRKWHSFLLYKERSHNKVALSGGLIEENFIEKVNMFFIQKPLVGCQ